MGMTWAYERLTSILFHATRPLWLWYSRIEEDDAMWPGRLGKTAGKIIASGPHDLWIHAVSVGEVAVAEAILNTVNAEAPSVRVIVSSTTPAGYARAVSSFGKRSPVIPYPLDFPQVVHKMARAVRPSVYACVETELWPNLIRAVRGVGARTVLLNARISERSFPKYRRIRPLIRPVLSGFSRICAISEKNARRLVELGAPEDRIIVTGNAKYEALLHRPSGKRREALMERMGIGEDETVFVAGSLRGGEEQPVVKALSDLRGRWPDLVSFLVPRHPKRVPAFMAALSGSGIGYQLWSEIDIGAERKEKVVLVDVIGPLFDLYGLATVAFVGGSLVPKGGQNLMEPSAWGCPVVFGPFTGNFEEASAALEKTGGGMVVEDAGGMCHTLDRLFSDRERRLAMGAAARRTLEEIGSRSASGQAGVLLDVLGKRR